jgi:hypothetical protein
VTESTDLPPRSPQRQQLADAIAARAAAERGVEDARQALSHGRDAVAEAESKLEAAVAETAAANERRAAELEVAAGAGDKPPPSTVRRARAAQDDCEDEVNAARAALEGLKARLGNAEDTLRHAEHVVVAHADAILRSVAKHVLADAEAAAAKLARSRLLLHLALRPHEVGETVIYDRPRRLLFDENWDDAVRAFGKERANRRMWDADRARKLRDENFDAAAIERFLERGLAELRAADERWRSAPELEAWRACREALQQRDPDAPLPPA